MTYIAHFKIPDSSDHCASYAIAKAGRVFSVWHTGGLIKDGLKSETAARRWLHEYAEDALRDALSEYTASLARVHKVLQDACSDPVSWLIEYSEVG